MRLRNLLLLLLLAVPLFAQDTNFSTGPQYLVTAGNPMFLRSIATPSLNLSAETLAGTTEVPTPVELPALAPAESVVYFHDVYWGEHNPDESFVPRLQPPTMTPDQTAWYMNYVANQAAAPSQLSNPESAESAASSSESTAGPKVIELTGGPLPTNLPASMFDPGVTGMTNPELLQQRGYGVSLGEVAAYWKAHKRHASHVITDEDLRRK
jgi:hypothetical protein